MKTALYIALFCGSLLSPACKEKNTAPALAPATAPTSVGADSLLKQVELVLQVEGIHRAAYSRVYWSLFDSSYVPQQACTDINNDRRLDYAWVVKHDTLVRVALAVSDQNTYRFWLSPFYTETIKSTGIQTSISPQPAGRKDLMRPTLQSLELKNNGFLIQLLEQEKYILHVNDSDSIQIFKM